MANLNKQTSSLTTSSGGSFDGDTGSQSDTSMPLGVGGSGGFGFGEGGDNAPFVEESSGLKINSSAAVIGLLLVCAAGGLFWMRSMSSASGAGFGNSEVETRIESFLENTTVDDEDSNNSGDSVILALTEDRTKQQVSVDDVNKNPFVLPTDDQGPKTGTGNGTSKSGKTDVEKQRDAARKKIDDAAKLIVVNSIMTGSNPLASLNGKIVRVGDSITVGPDKIKFTVEAIEPGTVELTAVSKEFDLSLGFSVSMKR